MKLEKYLENNYKPWEPIFLSDLKFDNLSNAVIKQELSNLVKKHDSDINEILKEIIETKCFEKDYESKTIALLS